MLCESKDDETGRDLQVAESAADVHADAWKGHPLKCVVR